MISKNEIQKALAINIGKNLADIRKRIGWTQGELAERIGVETETISRFERGATTPSLLTLQRLASVLNTSMAELLGESSPMPNDQARTISAWLNDLDTNSGLHAGDDQTLVCASSLRGKSNRVGVLHVYPRGLGLCIVSAYLTNYV